MEDVLLVYSNQNKLQTNDQQKDQKFKTIEDYIIDEENDDRNTYENLVDILFVLDTTGSMGWCIDEFCYRDHPPQEQTYIEKHTDLTNAKNLINYLQTVTAQGGGDLPEAVMDGLYSGLQNTNWRKGIDNLTKSQRFLFHIGDAPPHGSEYGQKSENKEWEEKGCPCGITKQNIQQLLNDLSVKYYLVKCGDNINKMEVIFKECFKDKFCDTINVQKNDKMNLNEEFDECEEIERDLPPKAKPEFHNEIANIISKELL